MKLNRMVLEPLTDDLTRTTWRIILLLNAIIRRVHCCHEFFHLVFNDIQVAHRRLGLSHGDYEW